jgi:hypothetical protein
MGLTWVSALSALRLVLPSTVLAVEQELSTAHLGISALMLTQPELSLQHIAPPSSLVTLLLTCVSVVCCPCCVATHPALCLLLQVSPFISALSLQPAAALALLQAEAAAGHDLQALLAQPALDSLSQQWRLLGEGLKVPLADLMAALAEQAVKANAR